MLRVDLIALVYECYPISANFRERIVVLLELTFHEKRFKHLSGIKSTLMDFSFDLSGQQSKSGYRNYYFVLTWLKSRGSTYTENWEEFAELKYGRSDNRDTDLEWKLAEVLTLYWLVSIIPLIYSYSQASDNISYGMAQNSIVNELLVSTQKVLKEYFSEYLFEFYGPRDHDFPLRPTYASTESKTIIDNLKDLPEKIASPIEKLLQNNRTDDELTGGIAIVYKTIENLTKDRVSNLSIRDKGIFRAVLALARQMANTGAGGRHTTDSALTVKDTAHNFALNVSLVQKLINLNDELSKKATT